MKLFITEQTDMPEKKCSGCGYLTTTFFGVGDDRAAARSKHEGVAESDYYGHGFCSDCMTSKIYEEEYEITE